LAGLDRRAWDRPRDGWLKAIREALGMSAVELAIRAGISDSRVGQIERAEVEGSLCLSTMERMSAALGSRYLYVVLPDEPLEDMVLRQAYDKALEERSIAASVASDDTELDPGTQEQLEVRTLELIDRTGLWRTRKRA
jgi:predicted DNA-binding mobile mystery protein A